LFEINAVPRQANGVANPDKPMRLRLVPFADAGQSGDAYEVWLPARRLE
jgi:hypothetical protein